MECMDLTPAELVALTGLGWQISSGPYSNESDCASSCGTKKYYCLATGSSSSSANPPGCPGCTTNYLCVTWGSGFSAWIGSFLGSAGDKTASNIGNLPDDACDWTGGNDEFFFNVNVESTKVIVQFYNAGGSGYPHNVYTYINHTSWSCDGTITVPFDNVYGSPLGTYPSSVTVKGSACGSSSSSSSGSSSSSSSTSSSGCPCVVPSVLSLNGTVLSGTCSCVNGHVFALNELFPNSWSGKITGCGPDWNVNFSCVGGDYRLSYGTVNFIGTVISCSPLHIQFIDSSNTIFCGGPPVTIEWDVT